MGIPLNLAQVFDEEASSFFSVKENKFLKEKPLFSELTFEDSLKNPRIIALTYLHLQNELFYNSFTNTVNVFRFTEQQLPPNFKNTLIADWDIYVERDVNLLYSKKNGIVLLTLVLKFKYKKDPYAKEYFLVRKLPNPHKFGGSTTGVVIPLTLVSYKKRGDSIVSPLHYLTLPVSSVGLPNSPSTPPVTSTTPVDDISIAIVTAVVTTTVTTPPVVVPATTETPLPLASYFTPFPVINVWRGNNAQTSDINGEAALKLIGLSMKSLTDWLLTSDGRKYVRTMYLQLSLNMFATDKYSLTYVFDWWKRRKNNNSYGLAPEFAVTTSYTGLEAFYLSLQYKMVRHSSDNGVLRKQTLPDYETSPGALYSFFTGITRWKYAVFTSGSTYSPTQTNFALKKHYYVGTEGEVGFFRVMVIDFLFDTNSYYDRYFPVCSFYMISRQVTPTKYETIKVSNVIQSSLVIDGQIEPVNMLYDPNYTVFRVPLEYGQLSYYPKGDATYMAFASPALIINNYARIEDPSTWDTFGPSILTFIAIVAAAYGLGDLSTAIIGAASTTAAVFIVIQSVSLSIIISLAASAIFTYLAAKGGKFATEIAVIATFATIYYGGRAGSALSGGAMAPLTAMEYVNIVSTTGNVIGKSYAEETEKTNKDIRKDAERTAAKEKILKDLMKELEQPERLSLLRYTRVESSFFDLESPQDFINRSIHTRNPGLLAISQVRSYVGSSLDLNSPILVNDSRSRKKKR